MQFIQNLLKKYQFLRFLIIGGIAAFADILLLYIFTEFFGIYYIISGICSFIIVTTLAFFSHKKITFACERRDILRQIMVFFSVNIAGLGLYLGILYFGTDILGFYYILVAIVDKFIVLGWNYTLNKFITFRHASN
jgi:putative flippase GtrA